MRKFKSGDVVICRTGQGNYGIYTLERPWKVYKKWLAIGADKNINRISEDDFIDGNNEAHDLEINEYIKSLTSCLFKSVITEKEGA